MYNVFEEETSFKICMIDNYLNEYFFWYENAIEGYLTSPKEKACRCAHWKVPH